MDETTDSWFAPRAGDPDTIRLSVPPVPQPRRPGPPPGVIDYTTPYTVPTTPPVAWSAGPSARRSRVSRLFLLAVLLLQLCLSLRLRNTASPAEAATLVVGRAELAHLQHGTPVATDLVQHVGGAPALYPVLAALGESVDRVAGARLVSLGLMLATTALLYSLIRRLFNERVALGAAAVYAVLQSTVVQGFSVSCEALGGLLLVCSGWIAVRAGRRPLATAVLAAVPAVAAVVTAHAVVLALPALAALLFFGGAARHGLRTGILRLLLCSVLTGGLLAALGAAGALSGLRADLLPEPDGVLDASIRAAAVWTGPFLAAALVGGGCYLWRERLNEVPDSEPRTTSRALRFVLVAGLCTPALLAAAIQLRAQSTAGLAEHTGLGLLFAAPLVGIALTRLVGAHFRYPQLGLLAWVLLLALGINQSTGRFASWPDASPLLTAAYPHLAPNGRYLTQVGGVEPYYLSDYSTPGQWQSATTSAASLRAVPGVEQGSYRLVILNSAVTGPGSGRLAAAVTRSNRYRLITQIRFRAYGTLVGYSVYVLRS